jgi:SAM-dependent methyltransferase
VTMDGDQADRLRARLREGWERAAPAWGRRAQAEGDWAMPVTMWLLDHLHLQPGQQVLELAAGAGDTGFMAAELVRPGGRLISSDGATAMLEVARERAQTLGIDNVEFRELELEWIDLPTATADAVVCRWGLMFAIDPGAALGEIRRVLRPGGRLALAVWDRREVNPWMTVPQQPLIEFGHIPPPEPGAPGPFALCDRARLEGLLSDAGFLDVELDTVDQSRTYDSFERFLAWTIELSSVFGAAWESLSETERERVEARMRELTEPFTGADGTLRLPGLALVAAAGA